MCYKGLIFRHGTALLNFGMQKLDFGKLELGKNHCPSLSLDIATNRCVLIFLGKCTEDLPSFFPQKLTVFTKLASRR